MIFNGRDTYMCANHKDFTLKYIFRMPRDILSLRETNDTTLALKHGAEGPTTTALC